MDEKLPKDQFILLSYVNTKLRDQYSSVDQMCQDMDIDKDKLVADLKEAGFEYIADVNQFR